MRELIAVLLWGFPLRFILSEQKFYLIPNLYFRSEVCAGTIITLNFYITILNISRSSNSK